MPAKLVIDGKETPVLNFSFGCSQSLDHRGRAFGGVKPKTMKLTIPFGQIASDGKIASKDEQDFFFKWAINPTDMKKGSVIFWDNNEDAQDVRTIEFKDAFLVDYDSDFAEGGGTAPIIEELIISPKELGLGGATMKTDLYNAV